MLLDKAELVPICPERDGGLLTPRPPAELMGDKVINRDGIDVTENYLKGAQAALREAKTKGAALACLKERSPSCGCDGVYDGSFFGRLVPGMGVTASLLSENGIRVFGESRTDELCEAIEDLLNKKEV